MSEAPVSPIKCPLCGGRKLWKDGLRYTSSGAIQRWLCRSCGFRFSLPQFKNKLNILPEPIERFESAANLAESRMSQRDPSFKELLDDSSLAFSKDVGTHEFTNVGKSLNAFPSYTSKHRVGVAGSKPASKNSAKAVHALSKEIEKEAMGQRGPTEKTEVKSLLFQYAWWMKKQGYAESTITTRVKLLKILAKRGANLLEPENVKEAIANQKWCNKRKVNAADAYTAFLRMRGEKWDPPKYKVAERLPFIPLESELDALIAGCGPKTATFLRLLKETACRAGEICSLTWNNIDFATGTIRVTPEKGSKARIFKLSETALNMLAALKAKSNSERVFSKSLRTIRRLFQKQRQRLARKLQNPRLLQIHFHTFRHWKATMLYHQTKDILYVMQFLGHKNIKNTLIYVQLEEALFRKQSEEYVCKTAKTVKEAKELIEGGFEYVTEIEGIKLFRKRK